MPSTCLLFRNWLSKAFGHRCAASSAIGATCTDSGETEFSRALCSAPPAASHTVVEWRGDVETSSALPAPAGASPRSDTDRPGLPRVSEDASSRTTVALLEAALVVPVAPPAHVSEVARVLRRNPRPC